MSTATLPSWIHAEIGDRIHVLTTAREGMTGPLLGVETTDGGLEVLLMGPSWGDTERLRYVIPLRNVASIAVDLEDSEDPF